MNVVAGRGFGGDDDDDEHSSALALGGCGTVWCRGGSSGRLCAVPGARFRRNHLALFVRVDQSSNALIRPRTGANGASGVCF